MSEFVSVTLAVLLLIALAWAVVWIALQLVKPKRSVDARVCGNCGHHAPALVVKRGSVWISVIGWLVFLPAGLLYSLWRLSTRHLVCESCGSTALMPADSPVGRRILREASSPAK
jgi:hypothetical protein